MQTLCVGVCRHVLPTVVFCSPCEGSTSGALAWASKIQLINCIMQTNRCCVRGRENVTRVVTAAEPLGSGEAATPPKASRRSMARDLSTAGEHPSNCTRLSAVPRNESCWRIASSVQIVPHTEVGMHGCKSAQTHIAGNGEFRPPS